MRKPSAETENRRLRAENGKLKKTLQAASSCATRRSMSMIRLSKHIGVFGLTMEDGPLRKAIMLWSDELQREATQ